MDKELLKEISDLISILIIDAPFCMPILGMEVKECSDRLAKTDGKYIYVNPDEWNSLSKNEKLAVIFHEWMHNALFHPKRAKEKDLRIFNFAADFVVNAIIKENMSNMDLPAGAYYDPMFSNKCVEEIYSILYQEVEKKKEGNKGNPSSGSGEPKKGKAKSGSGNQTCNKDDAVDELSKQNFPGGLSDDLMPQNMDAESSEQELKEEIFKAAENHKKIKGNLPAFFQRIITEIKKEKAPWEVIFQSLVKQVIYSGEYRTYAHPKSWAWIYGIAIPGQSGFKPPKIVVCYDTSGSITQKEIELFNNEVGKVLTLCDTCTVITADTKVHEKVKVRKISELTGKTSKVKFKGGGGTDFRDALKQACELRPDLIIFLTDGYGTFGDKPKNMPKLLWVINNNYINPPFGKYISIT